MGSEAETSLAEFGRIVGATQYMVLATADADGLPWSSAVWFASDDRRDFYWVSDPEARHSKNLAVAPARDQDLRLNAAARHR